MSTHRDYLTRLADEIERMRGVVSDAVVLSREDADVIGAAIESVADEDFHPYPLRDALARLRAAMRGGDLDA